MKKSNKLKMIWQKMKKPLIVLSFVGNILFLLFVIVGCVSAKKQNQQVNAETTTLVTLRGTSWILDSDLSSYTPQGSSMVSGVQFTESYLVRYTMGGHVFASFNFKSKTDPDESVIVGNYFSDYGTQVSVDLYSYYSNSWVYADDQIIHFTDEQSTGITNIDSIDLIQWFLDNGMLLSESEPGEPENPNDIYAETRFTFNKQINFNAPGTLDLSSNFIVHTLTNNLGYEIIYDFPYFLSNGELFNQIRLWYWDGNGVRYSQSLDGSNNEICGDNNNVYFGFMQYKNTYTNVTREVNSRTMVMFSDYGVIVPASTWVADEYRYLIFQNELTPLQRKNLSQFNNSSYTSGFAVGTTDVGIGGVFALLGSAFAGLSSLWSIQILPNISLGLLIFLPLIIGIILTIIWLVKR